MLHYRIRDAHSTQTESQGFVIPFYEGTRTSGFPQA